MLPELFRKHAMQFIEECVNRSILVEERHVYDADIRSTFMQWRFVGKGLCRNLSDYDKSRNRIQNAEAGGCALL